MREAAEQARAAGVAAVAISFLHAYANPAHERRAAEIVRDVVGEETYITCSSDILAEIREYERTSTAVVNAYVGPGRRALHPFARVEPGRGRDHGAAPDHAIERRRHERRGRDPQAGAPGRVGAGRRRRRLRLPRARGRHPERDLARHGRDDGEGGDPRGRRAGQDVGVRGRRRDQPQQPVDQGRRLRDPAALHRPVRDRCGWGQPRRGGRVRDAARRPRERRCRSGTRLLRPRRRRADPHRRAGPARLPEPRAPGGRDGRDRRGRGCACARAGGRTAGQETRPRPPTASSSSPSPR